MSESIRTRGTATAGDKGAARDAPAWRRILAHCTSPSAWMLATIVVLSLLLGKAADAALVAALLAANALASFLLQARGGTEAPSRLAGSATRIVRGLAWSLASLVVFLFVLARLEGQPWIPTARLALVLLMGAVTLGVPAMLSVTTNLAPLVQEGHIAYERVLTWVLSRISRTLLKTGFVAVAFVATGRFVVSAFALLLLVSLADWMKVSLASERVASPAHPASWNIAAYVRIAAVIAGLMLLEALAALTFGWRRLGLARDPTRLYTFSFLVLLDFGAWSLLSLRERRWFAATRPSRTLALAVAAELALGPAATQAGVSDLHAAPLREVLWILAYSAGCCLLVNDAVKVWFLRRLQPDQPAG